MIIVSLSFVMMIPISSVRARVACPSPISFTGSSFSFQVAKMFDTAAHMTFSLVPRLYAEECMQVGLVK